MSSRAGPRENDTAYRAGTRHYRISAEECYFILFYFIFVILISKVVVIEFYCS